MKALFIEWITKTLNPKQVCVFCIFVSLGIGSYAYKTYARNDDVEGLRRDFVDEQLYNLIKEQCKAPEGQRAPYSRRLQDLRTKYLRLTGASYELKCTDL
jgi:hypothetical protein